MEVCCSSKARHHWESSSVEPIKRSQTGSFRLDDSAGRRQLSSQHLISALRTSPGGLTGNKQTYADRKHRKTHIASCTHSDTRSCLLLTPADAIAGSLRVCQSWQSRSGPVIRRSWTSDSAASASPPPPQFKDNTQILMRESKHKQKMMIIINHIAVTLVK